MKDGTRVEESWIINILAPGDKISKLLVKRDIQAFNGQSLTWFSYTYIYNAHIMHTVYFYKHTMYRKSYRNFLKYDVCSEIIEKTQIFSFFYGY